GRAILACPPSAPCWFAGGTAAPRTEASLPLGPHRASRAPQCRLEPAPHRTPGQCLLAGGRLTRWTHARLAAVGSPPDLAARSPARPPPDPARSPPRLPPRLACRAAQGLAGL
ncbi:unnamed protein product, partial [Urochloa humidicola]